MSEIPKIARARLEQQAAGAGSHPDADQMTAFLERTLGAREREQVLEHLARCAECREVVAVALPPEEAAGFAPAQPAREFRWFEWQSLRWAAVAATFVIAVSLVFQTYRQAPETYSTDTARTRPVAAPAEPKQASPATAPAEAAKPAELAPADEAQPRADAAAVKEKAPSSSTVAALRDQEAESVNGPSKLDAVTRAKTGQKAGEVAGGLGVGSGAGAGIGGGRMDDTKKLGKEGKAEVGGTFAAKAAATPSAPAVAAGSMRGPAMQQQAGALAQQAPAAPPAAREELRGQTAAEPSRAAAGQAEPAKVTTQNEVVSAEGAEKDADKRARNAAPAPAAGYDELRMSKVAATARWSINPEGRVQRSTDSGQTWKPTTLAPNIKFRTVAAVGADVWAGGEGGALYHSSDSGAHWTRVALPRELASATIVRVEFPSLRHGTLSTSAGETWATSDAGATWQKR